MAVSKGPLRAVLGSSATGLKPHFHHCPARSYPVITKETAERVQVLASLEWSRNEHGDSCRGSNKRRTLVLLLFH